MSSVNQQSPRNVHQVVRDSKKDMTDMEQTLSKLRALSEDDKTEAGMLRSRIDEQSQLIMILKQRADEAVIRTQTLDAINKELMEFRDNANEQLQHEIRKFNILDSRFNDLASNHEEMIKYKDEYKRVNQGLRAENAKLREDNAKLFSQAIAERDQQIAELDKKCSEIKSQYTVIEQRCRQMQLEFKQKEEMYKSENQNMRDTHRSEMSALKHKLQDTEERLKGATHKLQLQIDSKQSASSEASSKIAQLSREKDELLDLAMQRGKLITKEQTDNKILQRKVEEMEKAVRKMEEKFQSEASSVNANIQVRKLREDLLEANIRQKEVLKEFDAFKKHSNNLLQKERELNERLRHLVG
ncbi:coiled-coil domain-containing protein 89-like [Haliotis cracherodii]|uniref:coiled-coil domain-containing protein 89-like n=1 Tax=Haliotis cracherodii TaxID=6455 RepID=UPI0039E94AD6